MPRARLVFDGDGVYTEKEARIHKLTQETETKIDNIPGVVDDVNSTSTTDALSANMGKRLQDQINQLTGLNKFLSTWDCTTGLPVTDPSATPFTYTSGNYYLVATVAGEGGTNYKPHGSTFTPGVASTAVETNEVNVNDMYIFDGTQWILQVNKVKEIIVDDGLSPDSTNAVENRAIYNALTTKQNNILDLANIRAGAALGMTSIQPGDNITELTNNVGYQTAGDVAAAIETLAPHGVGEGVLTLQKNSTTIDTFSANAIQNKTINITVPTTVAELSDASDYVTDTELSTTLDDYATKTYVDNTVDSSIHSGPTAPSPAEEGMLWYDTVNDVLKVYDGTQWNLTGKVYSSGTGINVDNTNDTISNTGVLSVNGSTGAITGIATEQYVDSAIDEAIEDSKYVGPTAPSNPTEGMLWYDTTNNILKVWDGDSWEIVGDGDMRYADFNFKTKTGATITLDLSTSITPSSNFIINAPSSIKDGQRYILRVTNGATAYTMTLGTNITNPFNEDLTLTEDGVDQFVFLAVGGNLELQPGDPEAVSYNAGKGIIIGDDYSAMQGPCDDGFHIPSKDEWVALYNMGVSLGAWGSNGGSNFKTYLKIPFAGSRWYADSIEYNQEHVGYYWSSTHSGEEFAYNLEFGDDIVNPTQFSRRSDANSIRPFKDVSISPNSNWTVLYQGSGSSGIYHSPSLGIISISSDGNNWITIADKNLGATTVYNNGNTLSEANCGKYYQRGNNYGFPRTGTVTTSSTQVNASGYGPGNYYESSTFIIRTTSPSGWDSSNNNNLWGETTGIVSDAISVDTSIIKNISVSGATLGTFFNACKAYGTEHKINFSGATTYTFRGIGFIRVGSMYGYALTLNGITIFSESFSGGNYTIKYNLGPYTASVGDKAQIYVPGSQSGSIGGAFYDYY